MNNAAYGALTLIFWLCYITEPDSDYNHAFETMPIAGTDTGGQTKPFACAGTAQRTLKDLRTKRRGQPVLVIGHILERKGQEATFEVFNDRLAVIKFADGAVLGYDPLELLLPTEIDEQGTPYFEVRHCERCGQLFPLTLEECNADKEPISCPDCGGGL